MSGPGTLSLSVAGLGALSLVSEPGAFCVGRTDTAGGGAGHRERADTDSAGPDTQSAGRAPEPDAKSGRANTAPARRSLRRGPGGLCVRPQRSPCALCVACRRCVVARRCLALCVCSLCRAPAYRYRAPALCVGALALSASGRAVSLSASMSVLGPDALPLLSSPQTPEPPMRLGFGLDPAPHPNHVPPIQSRQPPAPAIRGPQLPSVRHPSARETTHPICGRPAPIRMPPIRSRGPLRSAYLTVWG